MPKRYNTMEFAQHDNNSDDEESEQVKFMKENFTLEDFLAFKPTQEILEQNRLWEFDKKCDELLEKFYMAEVDFCKCNMSTLFINETDYANRGYFNAIVAHHVKPVYNLDVIYDNLSLCKLFMDHHQDRRVEIERERMQKLREMYKKTSNAGKTFDWSTKSYK